MIEELDLLIQRGQWSEVFTRAQALIQIQPADARLHAYLGLCYMRGNQFDHAIPSFKRAVTLKPEFFEAQLKLAQCLDRMQRYDEAVEPVTEALRLRPNDVTTQILHRGIMRNATKTVTDGWQKSEAPMFHNITLSDD